MIVGRQGLTPALWEVCSARLSGTCVFNYGCAPAQKNPVVRNGCRGRGEQRQPCGAGKAAPLHWARFGALFRLARVGERPSEPGAIAMPGTSIMSPGCEAYLPQLPD